MRTRVAIALTLLVLLACGARAEERKGAVPPAELGTRPIDVSADRLNADNTRDSVTFEGNVVARQGDVTMYANRLSAAYDPRTNSIERIEAEGDVRFVQGDRVARAPRATFYNLEQRVVLSGGATLQQGENTLQGDSVTIFLRENRAVVTGSEGGGRVRAVINPRGVPGAGAPKP
ncbi:MAG: lipopolysaccharide transport periplasmic protein LptA [Verrucomicrobiota bacterium]